MTPKQTVEDIFGTVWRIVTDDNGTHYEGRCQHKPSDWVRYPKGDVPGSIADALDCSDFDAQPNNPQRDRSEKR